MRSKFFQYSFMYSRLPEICGIFEKPLYYRAWKGKPTSRNDLRLGGAQVNLPLSRTYD